MSRGGAVERDNTEGRTLKKPINASLSPNYTDL